MGKELELDNIKYLLMKLSGVLSREYDDSEVVRTMLKLDSEGKDLRQIEQYIKQNYPNYTAKQIKLLFQIANHYKKSPNDIAQLHGEGFVGEKISPTSISYQFKMLENAILSLRGKGITEQKQIISQVKNILSSIGNPNNPASLLVRYRNIHNSGGIIQ